MSAVTQAPSPSLQAEEARLAAVERYDILDTPAEPAFDRIAALIRLIFSVETSIVSLIDAHRQWFKAAQGNDKGEVPRDISFCRHVVANGRPLVITDASQDPRFQNNPLVTAPRGVRFYAGVPLTTHDGHHIGTLCAIDSQPRDFSEREEAILQGLAQVAMSELELRRLATTDGLTGIATRRAFKEDALRFVALARRHRTQLSAVTFDIDKFKVINDTYGHAAGDTVLKAVTAAVTQHLRQSDIFGRLGGEEFAILLPDADGHAAMAVAEKLRHAILDLRFPGSHPPLIASASFGIATLDPGTDDLDRLLLKADEALYEAKRGGRNRAISWRGATGATTIEVERRRVLKAGKLVFNNRRSVISCTVRALWDKGAEVSVTPPNDLPEDVTLEIPSAAAHWVARVTQRRPNGIELEFAP